MKTSFESRVSRMGLGIFVDTNILLWKIFLSNFFIYSIFLNLLNLHKCYDLKMETREFRSTILF